MYQYLHKYFALHNAIVLPGIGSFKAITESAKLDFINKTLHAPMVVAHYDADDDSVDAQFCEFVAVETGVSESDVMDNFSKFLKNLKGQLQYGDVIHLEGIGRLMMDNERIFFTPDNGVQSFFPGIKAEKIIRQNTEHVIKVGEEHKSSVEMQERLQQKEVKKEKWWIAALVLAGIGIVAIACYYLFKG